MEYLRRARSPDSLVLTPMPPQYDGTAEQRKVKKNKKLKKKKNKKAKVTTPDSSHIDNEIDQVDSLPSADVADKTKVSEEPSSGAHVATPLIVHGETPTDRAIMDLCKAQKEGPQSLGHEAIGNASKEQDISSESTTIREMSVQSDDDGVVEQLSSVANDGSDAFVCHTHRRVACKFDPRCCVHRDPKNCSCPPRWSCCCLHHLGDCCHCVLIPEPTTHDDIDDNDNDQEEPPSNQGQDPSMEGKVEENGGEGSSNVKQDTQADNNGSRDVSENGKEELSEKTDPICFEEPGEVTEGDAEKVSSDDDQSPEEDNKSDDMSQEMGKKTIVHEDLNELNIEGHSGDKAEEMLETKTVNATKHEPSQKNEDKIEDKPEVKSVEMIEHKSKDKTEEKSGNKVEKMKKTVDMKEVASEMPATLPGKPVRPTDFMGPLAAHMFTKLLRGEFCDSVIVLRSAVDNFLPIEFHVHKVVTTQSALAVACFHHSNRIVAVVRENFAMIKGFELAFWHLYGHPLITRKQLRASTLAAFGYTQDARGQLNFDVNAAMVDLAICYATSGVFFQLHMVAEAGFTMIAELVDWDTVELILCIGLEITKFAVNLEAGAGPGHEQMHNQNTIRELQDIWAPLLIKAVLEFICEYVKENKGFALFAGAQATAMPDRIPARLRSFPSAVTANPKLSEVKFGSLSTVREQKPTKEAVISSAILINLPFEQLSLTFTIMTARNVLSVEQAQAVISAREARRQQALHLLAQQSGPGRSAGAGGLGYREYLAGTTPGPETSPTDFEVRREWVGVGVAVSESKTLDSETATRPAHSLAARE